MLSPDKIPTRLVRIPERPKIQLISPPTLGPMRHLYILYQCLKSIFKVIRLKTTHPLGSTHYASQLRTLFEQWGPVWIKLGKMLALRSDLLPQEFCRELDKIKDTGYAVPFNQLDLSMVDIDKTFDDFDKHPFAVTSVSMLYRARLKQDKIWVVVKIHRPGIPLLVEQDLKLLQWIVSALIYFNIAPRVCWADLHLHIKTNLSRELDYRYEMGALKDLKKNLKKHNIYVPQTFPRYSHKHLLVMEFIHGALMADFININNSDPLRSKSWLKTNHINPKKVAKRLFDSVHRQIFEDNLFHGDLHPGNIILLRNNHLAIIDCRSTGLLEIEMLKKQQLFLYAISEKRYSMAADIYFLFADGLPLVEIGEVSNDIKKVLRLWETELHIKELDYDKKSITSMFDNLHKVVFDYQFSIQWPLIKLMRAFSNLDQSLAYLAPTSSYLDYLRRYYYHAAQRKKRQKTFRKNIAECLYNLNKIPRQLSESSLMQEAIVRRQAQSAQGQVSKFGYIISGILGIIGFGLFMLTLLFAVNFVYQGYQLPVQGLLGNQLFALLNKLPIISSHWWFLAAMGTTALFVKTRQLRHHFRQIEIHIPNPSISI